jgi:hypothetical protein
MEEFCKPVKAEWRKRRVCMESVDTFAHCQILGCLGEDAPQGKSCAKFFSNIFFAKGCTLEEKGVLWMVALLPDL